MSAQPALQIQLGFPNSHREHAAQLYYEAFRQKLHPIFRDESRALKVLQRALQPSHVLSAIVDGRLAGLAGFKDDTGSFVDIQPAMMTDVFGTFGGWGRLLALAIFQRPTETGTLLMDGIVVSPEQRGGGIGSRLLESMLELAQRRGYARVRLDVVDTNPRARQLYERKGFIATESKSYPYLQRIFGFSGSTTMLHKL